MLPGEMLTQGNLPHWFRPRVPHFLTYRLADTIPRLLLDEWRSTRRQALRRPLRSEESSEDRRRSAQRQFFTNYDAYLDGALNVAWLAQPEIAEIIRENLYHHHGVKYDLLSYVIMPNHVHALLRPYELQIRESENVSLDLALTASDEVLDAWSPLAHITHSLKSYTATMANRVLQRTGRFWQKESYDHWVRGDDDDLERIRAYIAYNPVRAGLAERPEEYCYGSAYDLARVGRNPRGFVGTLWRPS